MSNQKPKPSAYGLSAQYWEATKRGELIVQRCSNCHTLRHYPTVLCSQCYSPEYAWIMASGRGQLHSWTVTHHAFHPSFAQALPYTLVTVDLEEGVRALGLLDEGAAQDLNIGMAVRAGFQPRPDGFGDLTFYVC